MKKTIVTVTGIVLALGLAGVAWFLWPRIAGTPGATASDRAADDEATRKEEERAGDDLKMSIEEILAARCEHNMPTYQCAECRYSVGAVKVDASLLKDSPGTKGGLVKTMTVSTAKTDVVLNVTGEVQLNQNTAAHISPRISGVIRSVKVDIGAVVKKDDVLLEMDSVELGQALNDYEKNKTLAELSRKNVDREKSLMAKKISSERDLIEAQATFEQNQAEMRAAEQKLHVLGLREDDIAAVAHDPQGILIGRLPARAPFDGTIIEKHAVIGELIEPGKDIMMLANLRTVWVWANIYEQDLGLLLGKKGRAIPVKVFVHAFPGRAFAGEIDYTGSTMDEQTRTLKVRATVNNEEELLRPGMFCEIQVLVALGKEAIAIPKVALLSDEGNDFVFRYLKDDYYVRRAVKKGREFDDSVEVVDGLKVGETIISDGSFLLKSDVLRSKMGAGCAD